MAEPVRVRLEPDCHEDSTNLKHPKSRVAVWTTAGLAVVAVAAGAYLIGRRTRLPSPDSRVYEDTTRSFYRALASLQVGLLDDAKTGFGRAAELAPDEPAAWANLSVAQIRLGDFDAAFQSVQRAAAAAPKNSRVEFLFGQLEVSRGRTDEGIAHFRRAVDLDPRDPRPRFALAQEIERAAGQNRDTEAQQLVEVLLAQRPTNLAVLVERTRLAAKRSDGRALSDSVARLRTFADGWPPVAVEQYRALERANAAQNFSEAARAVAFLRNVLVRVPAFREDLAEIRVASELIAEPFERFVALPSPPAVPSPSDEALAFSRESFDTGRSTPWTTSIAFSLNGSDNPVVFSADASELRRLGAPPVVPPFPGGAALVRPVANGLLAFDWNRDYKMDLAVAGREGVRLLVQESEGTFVDRTPEAVNADCFGVWAADVEMDGDLDLIVGVNGAPPLVLRNNGDGTWRRLQLFAGVIGVRAFAWGDLDGDGDPDAALLDEQGKVRLFMNRQGGQFQEVQGPSGVGQVIAIALGDVNGDGALDLVTLDQSGTIQRISPRVSSVDRVATWAGLPAGAPPGTYRLFLADLDNNGATDLVASGTGGSRIWLAGEKGGFKALAGVPEVEIFSVADLNGDGQLDLVGLANGQPVRLMGRGTKGYRWQVMRPRAQPTAGDQRINSFGIGGEIEVRSGLLVQKQTIAGPSVHFGLGTRTGIDVARIMWPNGVVQADFDRPADGVVTAEQRLKGSCPWVFAYDGTAMRFVTDFLWRSPLGLRINAQDTAGVTQTEDWIRIRGDQLVPSDGSYDVRITAELWETHFVDHVSLLVVDHPSDVEVFVDERFAKQAPALEVRATKPPRPVTRAWDEMGRDVTTAVTRQDGHYLATFELGTYQGIAHDHFVEFELGQEISRDAHQWLVANGWIYPTDSSINVAIGQGRGVRPRGLSLEAKDEAGRWVVVHADLGFPAGKNKTILVDLNDVARVVTHARRLRLRTNLEVYWDSLAIADGVDRASVRTMKLHPGKAELRYRGFSETRHASRRLPEIPIYDKIANIGQRWRDLAGYYTRFGDVLDLIERVDDRYVIMNAGDELQMRFPAPPPPAAGWKRDFVLVGDGWVKDGDYNTSSSKTVQPLPAHGRSDDETGATADLEGDPVYRQHQQDWQRYHTRFMSPDAFLSGLRFD